MPSFRSALLRAPRSVELVSQPLADPEPRDILVRLEGCGVCGSNLPVWQGREWFDYPLSAGSPGHEGWGVVEKTGAEVADLAPGDRVALLSHRAFAEVDTAPAAHAVKLPAALDGMPFPGEALGCAMNVFARSDIHAGQRVAVVGVGFLGALLVALAARAGAEVIALSRRPFALDVARRMGARHTVPMDDHWKAIETVKEITGGDWCDRTIEAAGAQWPLDLAAEVTRERGRLIIAGYHQDGPRQINLQLWNWRGLDVINAHERDPRAYVEGIRAAVEAVVSGRLDPAPLFTHRLPLDRLPRAFDLMDSRDGDFLKALVTYA